MACMQVDGKCGCRRVGQAYACTRAGFDRETDLMHDGELMRFWVGLVGSKLKLGCLRCSFVLLVKVKVLGSLTLFKFCLSSYLVIFVLIFSKHASRMVDLSWVHLKNLTNNSILQPRT